MRTRTYEYQSDFAREYFGAGKAEGQAEGKGNAVLAFLEARDIAVSADDRARIIGCTDQDQLHTWVRRAVAAETTSDLFD